MHTIISDWFMIRIKASGCNSYSVTWMALEQNITYTKCNWGYRILWYSVEEWIRVQEYRKCLNGLIPKEPFIATCLLSGVQGILLCNNERISTYSLKKNFPSGGPSETVQHWLSETARHVNKVVNSTRADIKMDWLKETFEIANLLHCF